MSGIGIEVCTYPMNGNVTAGPCSNSNLNWFQVIGDDLLLLLANTLADDSDEHITDQNGSHLSIGLAKRQENIGCESLE